jgi:hypothetical protein
VKLTSWEFLNRLLSLRKRREYILELCGIIFLFRKNLFDRTCSVYFFLMVGENSKRVLAGENSKRVVERVLYFFYSAKNKGRNKGYGVLQS